jgi:Tol biopolymer transport system component
MRIGIAVLGLLVLVSVVGCGSSGSVHNVVFSDSFHHTTRLVSVRLDRNLQGEVLPKPTELDGEPEWSPDGDSLAVVLEEQLYVMDEDGRTIRRVASSVEDGVWAWSPDGSRIAYTYNDIHVVRADGSERPHVLVRCGPGCTQPVWSPNGKRLAYHRGSQFEIVTLSGERHLLVHCVLAGCEHPLYGFAAWSPDGTWLALAQENRIGCGLSVVRPDGTQLHTIVQPIDSPGECGSVSWSPDGKLLGLARWGPSSTAIYRADGRNWRLVRLIDGASELAWSPDGRHLAYIDEYTDLLWIAEPAGGLPRRIGWAFAFDWSPDSTTLAARHPVEHRSVSQRRANGPGPVGIWAIDVATTQHRQIWPAHGSCDCGDPHWQPK